MRRSELISLGALAAIGVAALAIGRYAALTAESKLIATAQSELETIGFSDLALEADGLVLAVGGRVRSHAEQKAVRERLERTQGISRLYDNVVVVAPLVDLRPSLLFIQKDEEALTLSGEAPNPEARDLLGARAELSNPGHRFLNLMKAQDRRPNEDWFQAAEAAIDAISALPIARASVERDAIRVEGAVSDADIAGSVESTLRNRFSDNFKLEIDINAPPPLLSPYRFTAIKSQGGVDITVCAAPDAAERSVILGHFRSQVGDANRAEPRCQLANGAPNEDWAAAVSRAIDALAPFEEGQVDIADDRVRVTGFVAEDVNLENARLAAAENWPPLYTLNIDIHETLPIVAPFSMSAVKRPGGATLTGHAPSIERAESWSLALDATNQLALARGAPNGWIDAANAAIRELSQLKLGALTLTDREMLLAAPGDPSIRAQIRDRLQSALPSGYRLTVAEARTPKGLEDSVVASTNPNLNDRSTYSFLARREEDGQVTVGGVIGDLTMRSVISAYAKAKLGGEAMQSQLSLADGAAPAGWQRAVFAGLEALAELGQGEISAEPGAIYLNGRTGSVDAARRAVATLKDKTPAEFARFSKISIVEVGESEPEPTPGAGPALEPKACVAELNRIAQADPIRFASGSATIDRNSIAVLDALAAALERCPQTRFEIGGHTDSSGGEEENKRLSQRRAAAVRLSLVGRGAPRSRLEAVGYGEDQPIGDNDTEEGRAQNRRIEFKLL